MTKCNCSDYCFACVSQHSAFIDLVWSVTEESMELTWNLAQKKMRNELWQDLDWRSNQNMENAINEAVANVIYHTMTPAEIRELTE
jgi:hypothetical protein